MIMPDHPWIATVGWALVHFLWQGMLVWVGVAFSLRLLRRARPASRYAVASAGLLLCLAMPIFGVLRHLPGVPADAAESSTVPLLHFEETVLQDSVPPQVESVSLERTLDANLPLVVLLWAIGAGLLSLRFASGLVWVRNLQRNDTLPDADAWHTRVKGLSRSLGLERSVLLKVGRGIEGPVAAGLSRSVIFLPASLLTGMPPELVEALLAHELAHIKRHDYLANLLQSAIEVLLFYHPAVWWISRRIRVEREQICDDLAAIALGEPRRLALALQELDLLQLATPHLAQAAHGGNLMTRIRRLIHPEPRPLAWKALASILGLTTACVVSAAMSAPLLQDSPKAPPSPRAPLEPPAPPAPPEPPTRSLLARLGLNRASDSTHAFVLSERKGVYCFGEARHAKEVEEFRKKQGGDFVWFREKGQAYVISDPAVMARIRELQKPMDELDKQMDELGKEMGTHGEKMKALGEDMNVASRHGEPHSREMKELGKQMGTLGKEMGVLGRRHAALERQHDQGKLSTAEEKALEKQLEDLDRQMEALETKMEGLGQSMEQHGQKMAEAHKPMETIGKKMEDAGKPMEAVGKRMEGVGAQMEKESQKIEEGLKRLTQESLANGKAHPVKP